MSDVVKLCPDCGKRGPHARVNGKRKRIAGICRHCNQLRSVHRLMIQRCHNPDHPKFHNYGARDIHVHPDWHDYRTWREAMGTRPKGSTIERIDNDRGYLPGNVKWASRLEQAQNKRNNVLLELDGNSQTVAAWAREKGICVGTLWDRLRSGMSPEKAISKPIDITRRHNSASLETKKQVIKLFNDGVKRAEIARIVGRSAPTVTAWLRKWGVLE